MNDRRALPLVVLAVVVLLVFGAATGFLARSADVIRLLLGMLVLLLPGFTIALAVLPPGTHDASRRTTIALASAVGLLVFGGLLLNRLPSGLSAPAWIALSVTAALVSFGVALARGHVATESWAVLERWIEAARHLDLRVAGGRARRSLGVPSAPALSLATAVVLAFTALAVARAGAAGQDQAQVFTEFWALPQAVPGEVRLGITSHEPSPTEYTVRIESGGHAFATFDHISLDPGGSWETTVDLPASPSSGASSSAASAPPGPSLASPMRALLYRAGDATPYREATIHGQAPP
jgi:uncharacterized membrane protein